MMMLQTAQEFAAKMANMELTEYEMLMYEQCCRTAQTHMKSLEVSFKTAMIEQEREFEKKQREEDEKNGARNSS